MIKFFKLLIHIFKRYCLPKEFTRMKWNKTYKFTTKFLNSNNYLKIGAEVGVAGGNHIDIILKKTSVEKMYGIDPYINYGGSEEEPFKKDMLYLFGTKKLTFDEKTLNQNFDQLYNYTKKKLKIHGSKCELIRLKSQVASKLFLNNSLDFIFIDGEHDYYNCYQDIVSWYDKVKCNGYIMGHDYQSHVFPGVTKAVNEFFKKKNLIVGYDIESEVWYVKKIK